MDTDLLLEISGFSIGVLYLYWEYHANPRLWLAGLIMPAISMWLYYSRGLYADFAMNIYYLLMGIYGYLAWTFSFRRRRKSTLPIRHITPGVLALTLLAFAAVYAAIAAWLLLLTDSTVPWLDAFTTAGSIIGTWLLARKYLEQWLAWLAVDVVCVYLYVYKGIYLYATLYCVYTVIALLGLAKWRRLMTSEQTAPPQS